MKVMIMIMCRDVVCGAFVLRILEGDVGDSVC